MQIFKIKAWFTASSVLYFGIDFNNREEKLYLGNFPLYHLEFSNSNSFFFFFQISVH